MIKMFVKRIWLAVVTSCLLLMGGGLSFSGLEWNLEAKKKRNAITVSVQAKNPTTVTGMEKAVRKMEKMLRSLKNMTYFVAHIDAHKAYIEIFFNADTHMSDALKEVGNIVVTAKKPDYIKPPIVQQSSKNDRPLLIANVYSPNIPLGDVTRYAKQVIVGKLEKIAGVSYVEVKGDPKPEIQVKINEAKISHFNINIDQIKRAFEVYNKEKGFLSRQTNVDEFAVVANSSIKSLRDVQNVIVDFRRGIKLSDVAEVFFAPKEFLSENWVNGTTRVVTVKVFKTNDGNPLETSNEVLKIIKEWEKKHGLISFIEDNSQGIRDFFEKTKKTLIEAILIVIAVVVVFLGSFKASITPILAIPISLIATFFPMKLFGCSLNTSTLMAFLLSIGLVVDDAILVVENIIRHRKKTRNGHQAAIEGTEEIKTSIIVMTLTLACVFFPAIVSKGTFGATLKEFAITLSVSVILSGVISLTLTPSLSARIIGHGEWADRFMEKLEKWYAVLLSRAFQWKKIFVIFAAFSIVSSGYIIKHLPRESVPHARNREIDIYSVNSGNRHLAFFKKQAEVIAKYLKSHPEVHHFTIYMENSISLDIHLKNSKTPVKLISEEIMKFLHTQIRDIVFVQKSSKSSETVFDIYVSGNLGRKEIRLLGKEFANRLRNSSKIANVIEYAVTKTGYDIIIDYQKAAAIGCDIEKIERVIELLNTRFQISQLENNEKKYNIVTVTEKTENLNKLLQSVWNEQRDNKNVKVSPSVFTKVVQVKQTDCLNNFNGLPAFKIEIVGADKVRMGDLIKRIQTIHEKTIGHKTELSFTGKAQEFLEDQGEMQKMFLLSACFIFLILLAQFESLKSAFLVLLTAPLAIFWALVFIKANGSVNIYSTIALITLIGLITKHGILFVHTANQYVQIGMSLEEASYNAAINRLRPVLMTTIAMSLGFFPLLFDEDPAMIKLVEMARILFPGLTLGTIMTLFVIPCMYVFSPFKKKSPLDNKKLVLPKIDDTKK